jgi:mannose-6-phosphate isomerase
MTAIRLDTIRVAKPWGRHILCPPFRYVPDDEDPVGEIWFEQPAGHLDELMVKYLFTSEKLSIQVHPNDAQAQAAGYRFGKEEAWFILSAEPDARLGLGLKHALSEDEFRTAILDGSIIDLMDWKPVTAGDVIYVPAGTVHAIGAGIMLIEIQQNIDLTYRLYDYGRPRELHLAAGVAVSRPVVFDMAGRFEPLCPGVTALVQGGKFVVEEWKWTGRRLAMVPHGVSAWMVPVAGQGTIGGEPWKAGECWKVTEGLVIEVDPGSDILFAYAGSAPLRLFETG